MSLHVPKSKVRKPESGKSSPLTKSSTNQPVEVGRTEVPSNMGRTRTGIQEGSEIYGDRHFPRSNKC